MSATSDSSKQVVESPTHEKVRFDLFARREKLAKIRCEVWDMTAKPARFIRATEVKYGAPVFRIKLGRHKWEYRIVYKMKDANGERSLLKEYGNKYLYQTDVQNSVGVIDYYPYDLENVNPLEADAMLEEGLSEVFIRKGGMPFWYLLIPLIGMVVLGITVAILAPQTIQDHDLAQQTINLYNIEHAKVGLLTKQLNDAGITPDLSKLPQLTNIPTAK